MKIEKINDNKIRCTLARDDLANRRVKKISELAYGTKSKKPFSVNERARHKMSWI